MKAPTASWASVGRGRRVKPGGVDEELIDVRPDALCMVVGEVRRQVFDRRAHLGGGAQPTQYDVRRFERTAATHSARLGEPTERRIGQTAPELGRSM